MLPDTQSALEVAHDFPEEEVATLRPDAGKGGVQATGEFQAKGATDVMV